jgi:hypothetical protein
MIKATHTKREKSLAVYPRIGFRLSIHNYARVKQIARDRDASVSWVINKCLDKALPGLERR